MTNLSLNFLRLRGARVPGRHNDLGRRGGQTFPRVVGGANLDVHGAAGFETTDDCLEFGGSVGRLELGLTVLLLIHTVAFRAAGWFPRDVNASRRPAVNTRLSGMLGVAGSDGRFRPNVHQAESSSSSSCPSSPIK